MIKTTEIDNTTFKGVPCPYCTIDNNPIPFKDPELGLYRCFDCKQPFELIETATWRLRAIRFMDRVDKNILRHRFYWICKKISESKWWGPHAF